MKTHLFGIGEGPEEFPGIDSGKRWNGWQVPLFTMETCVAIAAAFLREDGSPVFRYDPARQAWVETSAEGDEWAEHARLINGVLYWPMGDGYMWERYEIADPKPAPYVAEVLAREIRSLLRGKAPQPWVPGDTFVEVAGLDAFHHMFGHFPSGCPIGRSSDAYALLEKAVKLACSNP
jgi:hypothetical protein